MNRICVWLLALALPWGMSACSSGSPAYCTSSSVFATKLGACDAGSLGNASPCTSDSARCATAYDQCSLADQGILNSLYGCIANAPACTPGQELTWLGSFAQCGLDAGQISSSCAGFFTSQFPDSGC